MYCGFFSVGDLRDALYEKSSVPHKEDNSLNRIIDLRNDVIHCDADDDDRALYQQYERDDIGIRLEDRVLADNCVLEDKHMKQFDADMAVIIQFLNHIRGELRDAHGS